MDHRLSSIGRVGMRRATTVKDFVRPIPLVASHARLDEVLEQLAQWQCDRAVVLDACRVPCSVVRLQDLVLPPKAKGRAGANEQAEANEHANEPTATVGDLPKQQPLRLIALSTHLEDLYHQLQKADAAEHWLVMAPDGTCLGLVDQAQWWAFWAKQRQAQDSKTVVAAIAPDATETLTLRVLESLIEELPLPLMVQTRDGHILTQNAAWRHQLAALQDPDTIWREITAFLAEHQLEVDRLAVAGERSVAAGFEEEAIADRPLPLPLPDEGFPFAPLMALASEAESVLRSDSSWEVLLQSASLLHQRGSCQRLPHSGNCVCLCEMESGDDRVWQFSGTRLGDRLPPIHPADLPEAIAPDQVWLVLAQDITEQHQVAKELAAKNADLVQLNRLKDEFLSCISHELRTPLTAVLGLSNLLKDQMVGELNERQARYSRLIYQSGRHLMTIVNDMLDLTRIETGQLELTMIPLSVETICRRAFTQAKQVHVFDDSLELQDPDGTAPVPPFDLQIQPDAQTMVADELRLRQMLANLLSNAMKFTDEAGQMGLKVERWDGWIAFTVWDTGIGIPKRQQHLIFQKFQQLEHPLTRRFEGTGLGLVLTQRLARLHGGDVTFTSTEGQGSQFTLLLPPDPSLRGVKPRIPQPKTVTWPGHSLVLVVEAVPQFLDDLGDQLRQLGYRVAIARSGTEALEKARQLQPLMIFLNPLLPLLSGWDVLTLLRSHPETRNIPILVTAGRSERSQAFRHGASDFLNLPVQPEALEAAIANLQRQQETVADSAATTPLTILHLSPAIATRSDLPPEFAQLSSMDVGRSPALPLAEALHPHSCRVLEVDDLEQANLLARVWKPDLVLLDGVLPEPLAYLRQLSQCSALATLPLITLSSENTQAAHQIAQLSVFPYQDALTPGMGAISPDLSRLLAVMRQAIASYTKSQ